MIWVCLHQQIFRSRPSVHLRRQSVAWAQPLLPPVDLLPGCQCFRREGEVSANVVHDGPCFSKLKTKQYHLADGFHHLTRNWGIHLTKKLFCCDLVGIGTLVSHLGLRSASSFLLDPLEVIIFTRFLLRSQHSSPFHCYHHAWAPLRICWEPGDCSSTAKKPHDCQRCCCQIIN